MEDVYGIQSAIHIDGCNVALDIPNDPRACNAR